MDSKEAFAIFRESLLQSRIVGDESRFHDAIKVLAADPSQAWNVISSDNLFHGKPYENEILDIAFPVAAQTDGAGTVIANRELIAGKPYEKEVLNTALHKVASQPVGSMLVLSNTSLLDGSPDKEELIKSAFYSSANGIIPLIVVMKYSDLLEKEPYKEDVLKSAYLKAAGGFFSHEVLEYATQLKGKSYRDEVLQTLVSTDDSARGIVEYLNRHHDDPPAKRFAGIDQLTAAQKFDLITLRRSDIYTSSYMGLIDSTLNDLNRDHKQLVDVLSPEQMQRMSIFLEAASTYHRIDDVLKVIPKDKLPQLIDGLADQAAKSPDLSYSGALITMMTQLPENNPIMHRLESNVKLHYENATSDAERDKFGIIAGVYESRRGNSISADMKAFYHDITQNPRYQLPPTDRMDRSSLVDNQGVCNQLMVFSNGEDGDGINSFLHFRNTYASKANSKDWKIEDKGDYIVVESIRNSGVPVRIYANKPDHFEDGIAEINKEVAQRQGGTSASFQVFVGRGHSFYFDDWLPHITSDMHLVHLGSCGGAKNEQKVIAQDPAQIIATGQTGTMKVNDPLLLSINNSIRTRGSIDWNEQQKFLDSLAVSDKEAYLLPHRNLTGVMIVQYQKLHKDMVAQPEGTTTPPPPPHAENRPDVNLPNQGHRLNHAQVRMEHRETLPATDATEGHDKKPASAKILAENKTPPPAKPAYQQATM